MKNIKKLLEKYPKTRPLLPKQLQDIFDDHYMANRISATNSQIHRSIESWCHTSIPDRRFENKTTLEIGAGTLNHLYYEENWKSIYDIIEPKAFLYKSSEELVKIRTVFGDYNEVPKNSYDRIISIAVLEHMEDLPLFLSKSAYNLRDSGYHSHSVPCEGYPMWNWSWAVIRSVPFRIKTGYSFKLIQQHEHLNNFREIVSLINYFYKNVQITYSYPSFCTPYLSLFANITFSDPNISTIDNFLNNRHRQS